MKNGAPRDELKNGRGRGWAVLRTCFRQFSWNFPGTFLQNSRKDPSNSHSSIVCKWTRPFWGTDCWKAPKSLSSAQTAPLSSAGIERARKCLHSDILFPYRSPSPRPQPDPTQHPEKDPKRTRNRAETEPNGAERSRGGAKRSRNGPKSSFSGWVGGWGGCKGKRESLCLQG